VVSEEDKNEFEAGLRNKVRLQQTLAGTTLSIHGLDKLDAIMAKLQETVTEELRLEALGLLRQVIRDRKDALHASSLIMLGETAANQRQVDLLIHYALHGRPAVSN
jgi:ATP phosphoribosyltransferase